MVSAAPKELGLMEPHDLPAKMCFGLGGQRCGSSWLHAQLSLHPAIRAPSGVKEVHFFDLNFERGADWYARHYRDQPGDLWWDSTPYYLYDPRVPDRIDSLVPDPCFVVLLRDPISRSLSHYRRYLANSGRQVSFGNAVAAKPSILGFSQYSQALAPYLDRYGRDRICIAFYEDIAVRPQALLAEVLAFLSLPPMSLSPEVLGARVNMGVAPRHGRLHAATERSKRWMKRNGFGEIVTLGRTLGLRSVLASRSATAPARLSVAEWRLLEDLRTREVADLAELGLADPPWETSDARCA